MLRAAPPGHPLQKPTVVQWDIGAMLSADGAADESVSPQSGINARTHLVSAFYRLRSTPTGFSRSAVKGPTSPGAAVTATAAAAARSSGPGSQTNGSFMSLMMTKAPAAEPAATPNRAVVTPSARYSSA